MNFLSVFPEKTKISDFRWKNADVTRTQSCVTCSTYFLDLLKLRYYRAKFCCFEICVTDFRERSLFASSTREQPRKGPSWLGLNLNVNYVREFKILSSIYPFFGSSFRGFLRRITFSFRLKKKLVDLFDAVYSFFQFYWCSDMSANCPWVRLFDNTDIAEMCSDRCWLILAMF